MDGSKDGCMESQPQNPEFRNYPKNVTYVLFVCLVGLRFYIPVNSYGHVEMVSSSNHTFFLDKLD